MNRQIPFKTLNQKKNLIFIDFYEHIFISYAYLNSNPSLQKAKPNQIKKQKKKRGKKKIIP